MTKKQNTLYGIAVLALGVIGGIAGTAFSMGKDTQRINGLLIQHTFKMKALENSSKKHIKNNKEEMDRLSNIIADQINKLRLSITKLTHTVGDVYTEVQVIKALMERMENDLKHNSRS